MKKLSVILTVLLFNTSHALAVSGPDQMQGGNNPGAFGKQNLQQLRKLEIEKNYIQTVPEQIDKEQKLKEEEEKQQQKQDVKKGELTYNPQFKLNDIVFEGNTIYSDKQLKELAKNLIGKDIYLEDIMDFTVQLSRFYQKNGYLTSYARILPQEIEDGTIKINIVESRVEKKVITGNKWEKEGYLKNIVLGGSHLDTGKVFNVKQLQGAMKNINKEDYLRGAIAIEKNPETDDTILELMVQDRFPISFDVSWDDFGREYTGRQRATMILGHDNLTGFGDKIYGGTILAQGTTGALGGYSIPINSRGTRLSYDYSHSQVTLGKQYKPLNIKGNSTDMVLRLTQPLKNTATADINASVAFDGLNSKTDILSIHESISDYKLRVVRTGIYSMLDDRYGRWISSVGADIGITGLGSSKNIKNGPQSSFYKAIASLARVQRLTQNSMAIARLNAQYTPQVLYAAEQMFIGGPYSIRGYQPSELVGDYGIAGSFELRFPIPLLGRILPEKLKFVNDRIKLATFYDWGYVKEHKNVYDYPQNLLSSIGFGTYLYLTDAISAQIGVGIPLGTKHYNEDSARMYFSINTEIDKIFMKPKERL